MTELLKVTQPQKKALGIATIIALIVGVVFLKNYLVLVAVAAIVAVLFNPIYQFFMRKGRSSGQAALMTFLLSLATIIIPVILVAVVTVFQIESLSRNLSSGNYSVNVTETGTNIINSINNQLASWDVSYRLDQQKVAESISAAADQFSKTIVTGLLQSVSGLFAFITTAIIYIYVFMSLIVHQKKIISTLKKLNPVGAEVTDLYFARMNAMTKATVRGQFIIAICQGLESAIVLSVAGLGDLFFFFALLLTALSVIPLGAGIITIPIGIVMILTGNIWQGVLVIANHLLIVTNIDNVLRPRLVPKSARLDSALMILAVFSGIAYFGFIGIVIGPVIMIVLQTTIQMYLEVYYNTEALDRTKEPGKTSLFQRLRRIFRGRQNAS